MVKLDLSVEQFKNLLDQFPEVMQVHLQGLGEPLLNTDFFSMVVEAKKRGIYVSSFTNATLISERTAKKIAACGLDQLWFSMDGTSSETYQDIRVGSSFGRVKNNIKKVVANCRESKTRLGVWFVAMKRNVHELPLLPEMAEEMGIQNLRVELVDTWGKSVKDNVRDLLFSSKRDISDLANACRKAVIAAHSRKLKLEFNPRLGSAVNFSRLPGCWAPWLSTYVTVEGFITPCCRRPDPERFAFGNIFKNNFADVWNSYGYQEFRRGLTIGKIPDVCYDCLFAHHEGSTPFLKYLSSYLKV